MATGRKTGGRAKGVPNRATRDLTEILAGMNCEPIAGMATIAMDNSNSPELRGRMLSELAGYLYPKRKAVEHSGVNGEPIHRHTTIRFVDANGSTWEPGQEKPREA